MPRRWLFDLIIFADWLFYQGGTIGNGRGSRESHICHPSLHGDAQGCFRPDGYPPRAIIWDHYLTGLSNTCLKLLAPGEEPAFPDYHISTDVADNIEVLISTHDHPPVL